MLINKVTHIVYEKKKKLRFVLWEKLAKNKAQLFLLELS